MIYNYILGLGSNIEPRKDYLVKAISELSSIGTIEKKSSIYETEAWGNKNQSNFYNAIINFKTTLKPRTLLQSIKRIEKIIGRSKTFHWGPREIDIDIIFCQDHTLDDCDLKIPHPEFSNRRFILEPMIELGQDIALFEFDEAIRDILNMCDDQSNIHKLDIIW
jgi:2-amino-4-hydroxy-6-hydroxymethyldihydropteridine diphosphokinase